VRNKTATPEHQELVRRNLELVAHISSAREAAPLLGVSVQKLIDWRRGKIQPLREPMPSKLSSNLRKGVNGTRQDSGSPLSRHIDDILHSDADDLTKTARMVDLWGLYRQKAIADVAELLRGDMDLLKLRAEAVRDLSRTTRLETEEAVRRRSELSAERKHGVGRAARQAARAGRGRAPSPDVPEAHPEEPENPKGVERE
jgi:hypothetical protein